MIRFSTRRLLLSLLVALPCAFTVACGSDDAGGTSGSGGSGGGTGGGGTGGGGGAGGAVGGCSEQSLADCEYPSLGVKFTIQKGLTVTDAVTSRVLPIWVRVPEGSGPFPLVVWSHGGGFNPAGQTQSTEWADTLAAHGYAVITIGHIPVDATAGQAFCDMGKVPVAECSLSGDEDSTGLFALVKTRDVIAVLDELPNLSAASVKAGGPAVDLDHVVVSGWSAGSRAPIVTHGAVFLPSPSAPPMTMIHTLPMAAIALSPMGPGYAGFFDDASGNTWQDIRGPVLMLTGDNDVKPSKPDLTGADRRIAFEKQPADGKRWLLYSKLEPGVGQHPTYALEDLGSSDERVARLSHALRSTVLAYLDHQVRNDATAKAWLDSQNAAILAGAAEWVHK